MEFQITKIKYFKIYVIFKPTKIIIMFQFLFFYGLIKPRNINQALLIIQNLIGAGNIASKRISIVSPFT